MRQGELTATTATMSAFPSPVTIPPPAFVILQQQQLQQQQQEEYLQTSSNFNFKPQYSSPSATSTPRKLGTATTRTSVAESISKNLTSFLTEFVEHNTELQVALDAARIDDNEHRLRARVLERDLSQMISEYDQCKVSFRRKIADLENELAQSRQREKELSLQVGNSKEKDSDINDQRQQEDSQQQQLYSQEQELSKMREQLQVSIKENLVLREKERETENKMRRVDDENRNLQSQIEILRREVIQRTQELKVEKEEKGILFSD